MTYEKNGNRNSWLRASLAGLLIASCAIVADAYLYVPPPTGLPPSGAAGGDLAGTFPSPTIAEGAVGTAEIENGSVALADQVNAAANSIRGNNTGSAATPMDLTVAQVRAMIPIASGTFTPSGATSTNCSAITPTAQTLYTRVNDIVTVSGIVSLDAAVIATQTTCTMTLPIASDLTSNNDLAGTICSLSSADCGSLFGDSAGNQVIIRWTPGLSVAAMSFSFVYQYPIK